MTRVRSLSHAVAVAALVATSLGAAACANARAAGPVLETPVPPPRVVPKAAQPIESQPIVASPPVGEVQPATPPAIKTPEPTPVAPQPAAPPPATPPVASAPAPTPPAQEPPPTLQTTSNPGAAEQRANDTLRRAKNDLVRIDVRALSADGKAQYDMAQRFVVQANEAIGAKNFEFAQQLADKAATLAALLQRR